MCKKFLIAVLTLLILQSCEYSPIYTKDTPKKFNIELINFEGDREINNAIKYNLKRYMNHNEKLKIFITTNSIYTKAVGTKNLAGFVNNYNLSATVTFRVSYEGTEKIYKFSENITINDIENRLKGSIYETNIKKNFAILFSDKLILQLTKIK